MFGPQFNCDPNDAGGKDFSGQLYCVGAETFTDYLKGEEVDVAVDLLEG
jgi:hypothetical protein